MGGLGLLVGLGFCAGVVVGREASLGARVRRMRVRGAICGCRFGGCEVFRGGEDCVVGDEDWEEEEVFC